MIPKAACSTYIPEQNGETPPERSMQATTPADLDKNVLFEWFKIGKYKKNWFNIGKYEKNGSKTENIKKKRPNNLYVQRQTFFLDWEGFKYQII